MVCCAPVQGGLVGGGEAKVWPAIDHAIGHAVTEIVSGDFPESKTGEGRLPGAALLNFKVAGSIAYCQAAVASNSRSIARLSCELRTRTVWFRGTGGV
jgi:hypothetical protein